MMGRMSTDLIPAAVAKWILACKEVQYQCAQLLGVLAEGVEELSAPVDPSISGLALEDYRDDRFNTAAWWISTTGRAAELAEVPHREKRRRRDEF